MNFRLTNNDYITEKKKIPFYFLHGRRLPEDSIRNRNLRRMVQNTHRGSNRVLTKVYDLRRAERHDAYPGVVVVLNMEFRVIRCRDGIQWILQLVTDAWTESLDGRAEAFAERRRSCKRCIRDLAGLSIHLPWK